jgi:hypothetical protein
MELARFPLRRIAGRLAEGIDSTLLMLLLTLSMVGLAVLYSASYDVPGRGRNRQPGRRAHRVWMWLVLPPDHDAVRHPGYVVLKGFLIRCGGDDVVNGARRLRPASPASSPRR